MLITSEATQSRVSAFSVTLRSMVNGQVFKLSSKVNPEQIGRLPEPTIAAAPFFGRSCIMHVSASTVSILDTGMSLTRDDSRLSLADGKVSQTVSTTEDDSAIQSASIFDPYLAIRKQDGSLTLFVGDPVARTISLCVLEHAGVSSFGV